MSSTTTKQELFKKLLAFKAELCKEQSFFQAAMVDADDKKSQDYKQAVAMVKLAGDAIKQVEQALTAGSKKEAAKNALVASLKAVQACKKNHPKKKAKKESEAGSDED